MDFSLKSSETHEEKNLYRYLSGARRRRGGKGKWAVRFLRKDHTSWEEGGHGGLGESSLGGRQNQDERGTLRPRFGEGSRSKRGKRGGGGGGKRGGLHERLSKRH